MLTVAANVPRVEGASTLGEVEGDGCVVAGGEEFLAVPPRCILISGAVKLKHSVIVCRANGARITTGLAHNDCPSDGE